MIPVSGALLGVAFALDVADREPAPQNGVVVAVEIGNLEADMIGLGFAEVRPAPAAAGSVIHPALPGFFDRFVAMEALEPGLVEDALEIPFA